MDHLGGNYQMLRMVARMPVLRINADHDRPVPEDAAAVDAALDALPPDAPVIVMVHGYKYSPQDAARDPHRHILSPLPGRGGRHLSWPRHLGFGRGRADHGLAIAFGWEARGSIWRASRRADAAGAALAELAERLAAQRGRPVNVFAHSLGARVALGALPRLGGDRIGRMILLAGAEFRSRAEAALATPGGRAVRIVNVTSRENTVFDVMVERLLQPPHRFDRALGAGLAGRHPAWVDLPIDRIETRAALAGLGFRVAPPERRICHWSGYLRPGLFPLYEAILRDRLCPHRLAAALRASPPDRRRAPFALPSLPRPPVART